MSFGNQTRTGIYFQKVDPILQTLLGLVKKYQEWTSESKSFTIGSVEADQEQVLRLLRAQVEILQQLQQSIEDNKDGTGNTKRTINDENDDSNESDLQSKSLPQHLAVLSEYISLPLNAILHLTSKETAGYGQSTTSLSTQQTRIWQIRESATCQLQEETARTISLFASKCTSPTETISDANDGIKLFISPNKIHSNKTIYIPDSHIVRFLIALAAVLPLGVHKEIGEVKTDQRNSSPSLDRGIDSQIEVLRAISTLISCAGLANRSLATCIVNSLDGALVARVSDACCGILLEVTTLATATKTSSSTTAHRVQPQSARLALQSLRTLETMFEALSQHISVWRSQFPGIFAALHRFFLRLRRLPISLGFANEMQCEGLRVLTKFLHLTLHDSDQVGERVAGKIAPKSVIKQLQLLAASQTQESQILSNRSMVSKSKSADISHERNNQNSEFFEQVNARLLAPLSVLLQTIMVTSSSPSLKLEAVSFSRVILLDTRGCWDKRNGNDLLNLVLEYCFVLQLDSDDMVKLSAAELLQNYREKGYLGADMSAWIVPRIIQSIEELPALAQRQDNAEMRAKLKVIKGYLDLIVDSKEAQSSLAAASEILMVALRPVFDIDFLSSTTNNAVVPHGTIQSLRFMHLSKDDSSLAKDMVRTLGSAFGIKHGTRAIDSCVADFYEAFIARSSTSIPVQTEFVSQSEWLHKWVGHLVLAREILVGVFDRSKTDTVTFESQSKPTRKRYRLLTSLSASLLPILTASHFWDLPTTSGRRTHPSPDTSGKCDGVAATLRCNAALQHLLLDLIDKFAILLRHGFEAFLPVTLCPVVEKASAQNAALVQAAARVVLSHMADACECTDTPQFLLKYIGHVVSGMLGRLRISGGKVVPDSGSLNDILSVCGSLRYFLQTVAQRATSQRPHNNFERNSVSYVVEIVTIMAERFNHLILRKAVQEEYLFDFILVCSATFSFLLAGYGATVKHMYSYRMGGKAPSCPSSDRWEESLEQFRIEKPGIVPGESCCSGTNDRSANGDEGSENGASASLGVTDREIEFVSRMMSRCCYFLSHESLQIRIASGDALIGGFRFLAFVAWYGEDEVASNEVNPVKTSILRQVAESWPSIKARLSTISEELVSSQRVQSIVVFHPSKSASESSWQQEASDRRILQAKLVTLVAVMAEGSGGFMADRFKNDVWPVLAKHFNFFISKQYSDKDNKEDELLLRPRHDRNTGTNTPQQSRRWQETEKLLIIAMLNCVNCTFGQSDCGLALSGLVSSVGTVALSFLGDVEEAISMAAFNALKKLIEIDCDALWRPLVQLSGQGIPIRPLKPLSVQDFQSLAELPSHILALKARELMAYAESLPEQALW